MPTVEMTCMTTKQKFQVQDPPVVVLNNGRYAYRVECPWAGKGGKVLHAFKFCSSAAYQEFLERSKKCPRTPEKGDSEEKQALTPEK